MSFLLGLGFVSLDRNCDEIVTIEQSYL
jgi:hypothetical protein